MYNFSGLSTKELVEIVENDGYLEEARATAMLEIKSRQVPIEDIKLFATAYFKHYFDNQLRNTVLTKLADIHFPESLFLTQNELKSICSEVFEEINSDRNDFYDNLPYV